MIHRALLFFCAGALSCAAQPVDPAAVGLAAERSIALLQKVQARWNQACFSCHHQDLPFMAIGAARQAGLAVDEAAAASAAARSLAVFGSIEDAVEDRLAIDPAISAGFAMIAGHAMGLEPSLPLAIHAYRIGRHQREDGHWATFDGRPPSSYSLFASTALGARALDLFAPETLRSDTQSRLAKARRWLLSAAPHSNEDLTMRLLGLLWTHAGPPELASAAGDLLKRQNSDGGWGQLPGDASDAYASGQALYALLHSGQGDDAATRRGVRYLLSAQKPDGSWHVRTRIHARIPVSPPYFESGFPYGRDQYISCAATAWSVMALAASLPQKASFRPPAIPAARPRGIEPWMESAFFGSVQELTSALDAGLSPNSQSALGDSLLMFSAHDPAKVKLLLARGADPKTRSKSLYDAVLVASLYQGNTASLQAILDAGGSARPPANTRFRAKPLVLAALNGDPAMVELLLKRGADPDGLMLLVGTVQVRPLDASTGFEHLAVTEALVRHGVKPDAAKPGEPAILALSAVSHKAASVRQLLLLGADPNRRDSSGYNALQHALSIRYAPEETVAALDGK